MLVAILAALTMVCTDVLGVIMVMAEANERGWLAGNMDALQWFVGIITTTISVTVLQGHSFDEKIWVVILVTIANVLGTKLGQIIGSKLMTSKRMRVLFSKKNTVTLTLKERVEVLERLNATKRLP